MEEKERELLWHLVRMLALMFKYVEFPPTPYVNEVIEAMRAIQDFVKERDSP